MINIFRNQDDIQYTEKTKTDTIVLQDSTTNFAVVFTNKNELY